MSGDHIQCALLVPTRASAPTSKGLDSYRSSVPFKYLRAPGSAKSAARRSRDGDFSVRLGTARARLRLAFAFGLRRAHLAWHASMTGRFAGAGRRSWVSALAIWTYFRVGMLLRSQDH